MKEKLTTLMKEYEYTDISGVSLTETHFYDILSTYKEEVESIEKNKEYWNIQYMKLIGNKVIGVFYNQENNELLTTLTDKHEHSGVSSITYEELYDILSSY